MSLKDFVLGHVSPESYYKKRFPKWVPNTNVPCVFHSDRSPSLSLGLHNGGARCHASSCGVRIGNIVHFESKAEELAELVTALNLYREFVRPTISGKVIKKLRDALAANGLLLFKIKKEMGLSPFSVNRFQLGYDTESRRITIPVFDQFNNCVNIRYYRLPSERRNGEVKIYNHKQGYGACDLFPWIEASKFKSTKPIFFMASEKEAMIMLQYGYQAICSTAGEGSYNEEWDTFFFEHEVRIIFDNDDGGKKGAATLSAALQSAGARKVVSISIPFETKRKDHKDFADWVLKQGGNPHNVAQAPSKVRATEYDVEDSGSVYPKLPPLSEGGVIDIAAIGTRTDILNQRVKSQGIVASKAPNTYSIPWKFQVEIKNKKPFVYEIPMGRELLRFVRSGDGAILQALQKLLNVSNVRVATLATITVTEVELIPIAVIDRDVPYVVQRCFYFGEKIDANIPYYLEVIPTTEIRTQETVGIITKIEPISKSIDKFEMTPEIEAELSMQFQPEEFQSAWDKLTKTCEQIAIHYTRVFNRLDWHLVALLTWLSPIGWYFPGEPELQRGWLNSLALGDTETGKSKVSKALQQIFNCGVFVNAENCTYVGLVGGAIKAGSGQLMLRWGRIPLSDRQLVVLEELSGLSVEEISNMSEVRSSGIARLDKGGINSQTNSRTRLLCLSNVRSQHRSLSGYLFGVKAIQELIGHGEDIARFDLITTLVDNEVDISIINRRNDFATIAKDMGEDEAEEAFKDVVSDSSLRKLAQFVWSLNPQQIKFTESAYDECLDQTKRLAKLYHPSIPIFKGGSGRYKLGRIAASIACFQFSWRDDHISVTKAHVIAAARLLELIYGKASFGYKQYSYQLFDADTVKDTEELEELFKQRIPKPRTLAQTLEALIHAFKFSRDELTAMTGLHLTSADQIMSRMYLSRVTRKGQTNTWEVTPAGKTWMEKFINRLLKRK